MSHNLEKYSANSNIVSAGIQQINPLKISNFIKFDFLFISHAYCIKTKNSNYTNVLQYIHENNLCGKIFHPKQLYNLFNDSVKILYYSPLMNIVVEYAKDSESLIPVDKFVQDIESYSYSKFYDLTMKSVQNNLVGGKLLLLAFVGNSYIGIDLIKKIIDYKKRHIEEEISISFCIHINVLNEMVEIINDANIDNCAIFCSNEFGNDIAPTLLMYDAIVNYLDTGKIPNNYEHIIKLHTKSDKQIFEHFTSFLLDNSLETILSKKNENCKCVGYEYFYQNDFNKKIHDENANIMINDNLFVPYTIFLTTPVVMDCVLLFLKREYKHFFINNMYDDNSVNYEYSFPHFTERLFGKIDTCYFTQNG